MVRNAGGNNKLTETLIRRRRKVRDLIVDLRRYAPGMFPGWRPAGRNSRPYAQQLFVFRSMQLDVFPAFGPRPHKAHLPAQHVPQLGSSSSSVARSTRPAPMTLRSAPQMMEGPSLLAVMVRNLRTLNALTPFHSDQNRQNKKQRRQGRHGHRGIENAFCDHA